MSEYMTNAAERSRIFLDLSRAVIAGRFDKAALATARPWIDAVAPGDIARLVDALVGEGMTFDRLKPAIGAVLNLYRKPLEAFRYGEVPVHERFLASLTAENRALIGRLDAMRPAIAAKSGFSSLRAPFDALASVELHFRKKENILFPRFESRFPEYRCVRLMWAIHDDARRDLLAFGRILSGEDGPEGFAVASGRLFFDLHALAFREECILFPLMASLFDPAELEDMYEESREYGYAFLSDDAIAAYERFVPRCSPPPPADRPYYEGHAVRLDRGALAETTLAALLVALPQDITFVDDDDRVAFYSNGAGRVFPRSPSVIGRKVADCHPHGSVDRVMGIIGRFRSGAGDREAFWLEMRGRFIHIEYRAVRSQDGIYLGTLETSEDLTEKRGLSGEKRL